jgi:DNA-binding beta-propeller fold protein YncE
MKPRQIQFGFTSMLASALLALSLVMTPAAPAMAAPFAYVTNFDVGGASVIDVATNTVVATLPSLGTNAYAPFEVAVTPDGKHAYVSCQCTSLPPNVVPPSGFDAPLLSVIDTTTNTLATQVFGPTFTDQGTFGLAVTPDGSRVYVAGNAGIFPSSSPTIFVIDTATNTLVANITDSRLNNPKEVTITPDGSRAYVTDNTTSVHVVDTNPTSPTYNTIVAEVGTTSYIPIGVAITPDGSRAYVPAFNGFSPGAVLVIDTNPASPTYNTTIAVIGISGAGLSSNDVVENVAITPDGGRAYVTVFNVLSGVGGGPVQVIDTRPGSPTYNTVVTTISIPTNQLSWGIAITADGTRAYVTDCSPPSGTEGCRGLDVPVSVIDTNPASPTYNTVVASVTAGTSPVGVAITPGAVAQPAPTSGTACNGTYDGTFTGSVTVSAGQSCMFISGGTITGNVSVVGGTFGLNGATVGSNLTINAGSFTLAGATIGGNLAVVGILPNTASNSICGTMVSGNMKFDNNGTSVQIGSATPSSCAGNTFDGTFEALSNTSSTLIFDNAVGRNMAVNNNTGPTDVVGNNVSGTLQCLNNTQLVAGSGNTAKKKSGQCS